MKWQSHYSWDSLENRVCREFWGAFLGTIWWRTEGRRTGQGGAGLWCGCDSSLSGPWGVLSWDGIAKLPLHESRGPGLVLSSEGMWPWVRLHPMLRAVPEEGLSQGMSSLVLRGDLGGIPVSTMAVIKSLIFSSSWILIITKGKGRLEASPDKQPQRDGSIRGSGRACLPSEDLRRVQVATRFPWPSLPPPVPVTEKLFCIITNIYVVSPGQILFHILKTTVLYVVSLNPD